MHSGRAKRVMRLMVAAMVVVLGAGAAAAQDVTLRLHQFLPAQATVPSQLLEPWAERIETQSNGRIAVEIFSAMTLGGRPPDLISQVRDGVVDIVFTLPGYTPGLFPRTEVFELPFIATSAEATALAFWDLYASDMADTEYADFRLLATWVHGPGVIHVRGGAIATLEDMERRKLRGPTRVTTQMLEQLGAAAIGMPVPAIVEMLPRGVIDGAVVPWEVTPSLRLAELTDAHTEFGGETMVYTAAFILAMNPASYEALPDDLKAVIDANSGAAVSGTFGRLMEAFDAPARAIAVERGNRFALIEGEELARWQAAAAPVVDGWIAEMDDKGIDGADLLARARAAIASHARDD